MKRLLLGLLTGCTVAVFLAAPLRAQNTANQNANHNQASLRLVIVDQTGAGIPMAEIVITPKSSGARITRA